ncbi:hypothetical protein, partial [Nocardia farcinica]|uniref:hypothetical protein n=1 Tax=Nocardia farcinica TaxID=37329 RepID=UPI0024541AF4
MERAARALPGARRGGLRGLAGFAVVGAVGVFAVLGGLAPAGVGDHGQRGAARVGGFGAALRAGRGFVGVRSAGIEFVGTELVGIDCPVVERPVGRATVVEPVVVGLQVAPKGLVVEIPVGGAGGR